MEYLSLRGKPPEKMYLRGLIQKSNVTDAIKSWKIRVKWQKLELWDNTYFNSDLTIFNAFW